MVGTGLRSIVEHEGKFHKYALIASIVLGILLCVLIIFSPESLIFIPGIINGSDNHIDVKPLRANNYVPEKSIPYPFPGTNTNQNNYTNSIGMDFVLIPAGEFDMGSPSDEWDRYGREGPVHKVNNLWILPWQV
ncbi:MAG: hypothetical protein OIN87_09105 [Candidatus Methanoperedens sp.]|nr:hypothetical protein [Candidatus Methanoperedens sp.]